MVKKWLSRLSQKHPDPQKTQRFQMPQMSMEAYAALLKDIPLPSEQQIDNFSIYVATRHSWYKHLPHYLPGVRFYFFLSPHVGKLRFITNDEKLIYVDPEKFPDLSIEAYQRQYGFLHFFCAAGVEKTHHENGSLMIMPRRGEPTIADMHFQHYELPKEIKNVGGAELTSLIHPRTFRPFSYRWCSYGSPEELYWPEESGGRSVIQSLQEHCVNRNFEKSVSFCPERDNQDLPYRTRSYNSIKVDPTLRKLLLPEHNRQLQEMKNAIGRVCDIIKEYRS